MLSAVDPLIEEERETQGEKSLLKCLFVISVSILVHSKAEQPFRVMSLTACTSTIDSN